MKKFETIRQEIKRLSDEQRYFKPLRKPKNAYALERTAGATPEAASKFVRDNKYELRHLFQAYSILKDKPRQETKHKEISESYVIKLVEKYGITV